MKKRNVLFNYFLTFIILALLLYIYKSIFLYPITSAGDLPYYWNSHIKELGIPYLWNPLWPTGLGGNQALIIPLKLYFQLPIALVVNPLNIPWEVVERVVFFFAFFVLSIYTSYRLTKSWLGSLIYAGNTWILMVFSGGQMGVALGYSIAPLVLQQFLQLIDGLTPKPLWDARLFRSSLLAGLFLSLLIMFDIRITYIIALAIGVYVLVYAMQIRLKEIKKRWKTFAFYVFVIPGIVTLFLNIYWMLPLFFSGNSLSGEALQPTIEQVKFFSFATYANTLGLLHPNWPENIFGKIGFMKPEYLILPPLAYASLLFVKPKKTLEHRWVLYFAFLGLLGVFLAKGANEPFGSVYLWLFENVPGFNMFRDSTKFYVLIALAYSFLIPFTISQIANIFKTKWKNAAFGISTIFIIYFAFLIWPALSGQVGGLFKMHPIPKEYVQLKDFLDQDKRFSRTLWIPQHQRFGYSTHQHPVLNGIDMYPRGQQKNIVNELKKPETVQKLQEMSVAYVIVPYDSEQEIFVHDRRYDEKAYKKLVSDLEKISWLKKGTSYGNNIVFAVGKHKDHFWLYSDKGMLTGKKISYKYINPTEYSVSVSNVKKGDKVIFSERFDKNWIAKSSNFEVQGSLFSNNLNSFVLPNDGTYTFTVYYEPQRLFIIGLMISGLWLVLILIAYFSLRRKTIKKRVSLGKK